MPTRLFERIQKFFLKPKDPDIRVRFGEEMTLAELRKMLRGERDFVVRATPDGNYAATCKSCQQALWLVPQNDILWFKCPGCRRMTCYPEANARRDVRIAERDGHAFEYELYFNQYWPADIEPPFSE